MAIKIKDGRGRGIFRDDEDRALRMIGAAAEQDPSIYGDMTDEEEKEYLALVAEMKAHPNGTWDVPYDRL